MTPHLVVDADFPGTEVPREFVDDGQIVLNIAPGAVRELVIGNDWTSFSARFSGVVRNLLLPTEAVLGIVTRESRQGMVFPEPAYPQDYRADARDNRSSRRSRRPRPGNPRPSPDRAPKTRARAGADRPSRW